MVPIELFMVVLWLTFSFVGLAREFPKELGATIGFIGMLLVLDLGLDRLGGLVNRGLGIAGLGLDLDLLKWLLVTAILLVTIYFVYEGEGLVYGGASPPGPLGNALDLSIGLFNGWLVVGTWWYYTHILGYPIKRWGLYQAPLSARGEQFVNLTPMALIPDERSYWYLTAILLFLIVLKVAR
jgi:hypothetical protein